MKFKYLFLLAIVALLFSSCEKKELICNIEHDFALPRPLVEIADVYVTYYDDKGNTITEQIEDGKFKHEFKYVWKDKEFEPEYADPEFHKLIVTLNLKDGMYQSLQDDTRLFDDPDAYITYRSKVFARIEGREIAPSYCDSTFVFPDYIQQYKYTIDQQKILFNIQDQRPFLYATADREPNNNFCSKITVDIGELDLAGLLGWRTIVIRQ